MVKNRYNRYLRLWKINKNTPTSSIINTFRCKIVKGHMKKQSNKKAEENVKTEVLM